MNFFSTITALSASGPLASRAFIPLFIACLMCRFPEAVAFLHLPPMSVPAALDFLVSDWFLTIIGVLAVLEIVADKQPDLKAGLDELHHYSKAVVAILVTLMILPPDSVDALQGGSVPDDAISAGMITMGAGGLIAMMTGGLTFYLSWLRSGLMEGLDMLDPDNDLGLKTIVSFAEDAWGVVGFMICLVLPMLALLLAAMLLAAAATARIVMRRIEKRDSYPCPGCSATVMPTATSCKGCHTALTPVRVFDWRFLPGYANVAWTPVARDTHRQRLIAKRRCPDCAETLKPRTLLKSGCGSCGYRIDSESTAWFDAYHKSVMKRAWRLMLPLTLIGLIPVVGMAVAMVTMRLYLAAPLRAFSGFGGRFMARWGLRLFALLLLIPGSLPFLSLIAVPLLVLANLWVYGGLARRQVRVATVRSAKGKHSAASASGCNASEAAMPAMPAITERASAATNA